MLKVITVTNSPEHAEPLIRSLVANNWDYVVIETEWKGFGTKLIETYNYLKANPDVTEFIFCDAFDVLALGNEDEFKEKLGARFDKLVCSCERGLWPPTLIPFKTEYEEHKHGFNYVNSGLYYAPSKVFIKLFEKYPPFYEIDDQQWLNMAYLLRNKNVFGATICPDFEQSIFNSHSFIHDGEYGYENGRIQILGNEPIFVHKNGRTIDEKLDNLMKL